MGYLDGVLASLSDILINNCVATHLDNKTLTSRSIENALTTSALPDLYRVTLLTGRVFASISMVLLFVITSQLLIQFDDKIW